MGSFTETVSVLPLVHTGIWRCGHVSRRAVGLERVSQLV